MNHITAEDYTRAERFLPGNVRKMTFRMRVAPNWIGEADSFWYRVRTQDGNRFMLVDPERADHREAFDHERLAACLSRATGRAYVHTDLPFDRIEYRPGGAAEDSKNPYIIFRVEEETWKCNLSTYDLARIDVLPSALPFASHPARPAVLPSADRRREDSPDGKWTALVKDHDLYVRSAETDEEIRLTTDGIGGYSYAEPLVNPLIPAGLAPAWQRTGPAVSWSPNSKRLLAYKMDSRSAGLCHLVQSTPPDGTKRPRLYSYVYALPGDETAPACEPFVFNIETMSHVKLKVGPIYQLYYGAPYCWIYWTENGSGDLLFLHRERGCKTLKLYRVNQETGEARVLIEETSPTAIDSRRPQAVSGGSEIIWHSETDGWAHLYLYDGNTGKLKNQITSGAWVVREIKYVDEEERVIYFTASGREKGGDDGSARDPYYRHLYRVRFDGTGLELLTPEDAEHQITFTPSSKYFLDCYSRVDLAPVTVLRTRDGDPVRELERADLDLLFAAGWKFPERFRAKARDGVTDIYGMIIRPSNFDPSRKYPVIEANYSGPHTIRTPKAFAGSEASRQFWHDQAIAELGFIVVTVDGLGMAHRSKAFQDFSYRNLADGGFKDHICAFRQLADRYPEMDLSRVGIYGGSAGGYAACQAILAFPDFFKVAVAWAGNHDHRTDKATWVERYMGLPVGPHYEEQANPMLAANLKGHLLLMHGEMDENVPPAATLQLADALIKANKDFDLLILPNGVHGSGYHPYVTRKRWDYFVQHLAGCTPPPGYAIGTASL